MFRVQNRDTEHFVLDVIFYFVPTFNEPIESYKLLSLILWSGEMGKYFITENGFMSSVRIEVY